MIKNTAIAGAVMLAAISMATSSAQADSAGVGIQLLDTTTWTNIPVTTGGITYLVTATYPDTFIGMEKVPQEPLPWSWAPVPFSPGETRTYHIKVTDTGSGPETMGAFASAATVTPSTTSSIPGMKFSPISPNSENTATSWTDVQVDSAALQPGQSEIVDVVITVPSDAQPGLYGELVCAGMEVTASDGTANVGVMGLVRGYITVSLAANH